MIDFLTFSETVGLIAIITSPLYVGFWKLYDKMNKIGCDVTALKTVNDIYHDGKYKTE